jgi:hypothetical protein
MDKIESIANNNHKINNVYQDILPILKNIYTKLESLEKRIDNIERKSIILTNKDDSKINVIDSSYNIDIDFFPEEMHKLFESKKGIYFCNCMKDVFDDIIDLKYKRLKNINNLQKIGKLMENVNFEEKFIVDYIYNSDFEGHK